MPEVKMICGAHLIAESNFDEDAQHNTDLHVLTLEPVRIAVRIRQHKYLERYPDEITIRAGRPSGTDTELAKLIAGWGRFIFYGFASQDETHLAAWTLGDLNVFRLWFMRELTKGTIPGKEQSNRDGSSTFRAFNITELPKDFVVARLTQQADGRKEI
jgi:hypothetical protein